MRFNKLMKPGGDSSVSSRWSIDIEQSAKVHVLQAASRALWRRRSKTCLGSMVKIDEAAN